MCLFFPGMVRKMSDCKKSIQIIIANIYPLCPQPWTQKICTVKWCTNLYYINELFRVSDGNNNSVNTVNTQLKFNLSSNYKKPLTTLAQDV